MDPKKQRHNEKHWIDHIMRWKSSGLSQRRYCANEGLSYWSFREWLKRTENIPIPGNDLVRLPREILNQQKEGHSWIEVLLSGNITIRVNRGFDGELLRDVIRELRESR